MLMRCFLAKFGQSLLSNPLIRIQQYPNPIVYEICRQYGCKGPSKDAYDFMRCQFLESERGRCLGSSSKLKSKAEKKFNKMLMKEKKAIYKIGMANPHKFPHAKHYFSNYKELKRSKLYNMIKGMPKGGVLHAHDTALVNTDFLIELTHRENLWVGMKCGDPFQSQALRFSKCKPKLMPTPETEWKTIDKVREQVGCECFDKYLRRRLTLYPKEYYKSNNEVWLTFMNVFALLDGLVLYKPVWGEYYKESLKQFKKDNVQYLELRTLLPKLYDLDGKLSSEIETADVYKEAYDCFMKKNKKDFIGSKLIYAPLRFVDLKGFSEYVKILLQIKKKYPDFIAGFDLVGQEEVGKTLYEYREAILKLPKNIKFFFHAGETNWFGTPIDDNLIDAVLMGTKRIGHGYAIPRHPKVMEVIKKKKIGIEVCPLSNQVLQLVSDLRNHPCSILFSDNYPVVISSDDPSFWKAPPLTMDFHAAFVGMAPKYADLRFLKKLAKNSLELSAMSKKERKKGKNIWKTQWKKYIAKQAGGGKKKASKGKSKGKK